MSFDDFKMSNLDYLKVSQSLSSRAMSFDYQSFRNLYIDASLNPFRAGQCLSTNLFGVYVGNPAEYQSLSSRAMSFDRGNHHVFI